MSSKSPTHLMVTREVPAPNAPAGVTYTKTKLYRIPEGMLIAEANDGLLSFGEDPQKQQMRRFIDHEHAISKMREMSDRDWAMTSGEDPMAPDFIEKCRGYAANIKEDDGQQRILTPDQAGKFNHPILVKE